MTTHLIEREQVLPYPPDDVFHLFAKAANLGAITPSWLRFEILTPEPIEMREGTRIEYRLRVRGVPMRWISRIDEWEPPLRFVDRQLIGPYRLWRHLHEFEAHPDGTLIRDTVRYEIPFGPLGLLAHAAFVRHDLERVFDHRRDAVPQLLANPAV